MLFLAEPLSGKLASYCVPVCISLHLFSEHVTNKTFEILKFRRFFSPACCDFRVLLNFQCAISPLSHLPNIYSEYFTLTFIRRTLNVCTFLPNVTWGYFNLSSKLSQGSIKYSFLFTVQHFSRERFGPEKAFNSD